MPSRSEIRIAEVACKQILHNPVAQTCANDIQTSDQDCNMTPLALALSMDKSNSADAASHDSEELAAKLVANCRKMVP